MLCDNKEIKILLFVIYVLIMKNKKCLSGSEFYLERNMPNTFYTICYLYTLNLTMYVLKDYPDYFFLKLLLKTGWCKQTHEFYTAIKLCQF